jgi:hypothetical protein
MPIKFGWAIDVPSRVSANGSYSRKAVVDFLIYDQLASTGWT